MAELKIASEDQLIKTLLESEIYKHFKETHLPQKIDRECRAWKIIEKNRGKYSKEILNNFFDTVDIYELNKRWFGSLLALPNRNLIFKTSLDSIVKWIDGLLFSSDDVSRKLNTYLEKIKIKGASNGLATLLLYLSNPDKFNVWVNKTEEGLLILNRLKDLSKLDWGLAYIEFNTAALKFRKKFDFQPQEIDWILTIIASYVEKGEDYYLIDEDVLENEKISISVDDITPIDDVVGDPMDLGIMRWAPTNEMGVVALFVAFHKELGFPYLDVIRSSFPDAAAYQKTTKGNVRRYIEFEFKSSRFKNHLSFLSKRPCHYVICWENDWKGCPISVIELKTEIPKILSCKKM
ncbi:MAG: hypothetical protein JW840_09235 [Candidatus Thermoplasmatota archaeon]|nr:hypothetical protein [Candidatus Thermoplasmatota archaeon]